MRATRNIIPLAAMAAGTCLLSFLLSRYVVLRQTRDNLLLATRMRSLSTRGERIPATWRKRR